jgi:hypothetical protein
MDQNNTVFNIDELITAYIDNEITDSKLRSEIEDLLSRDENLRKKYQCELLTKKVLQSSLKLNEVPPYLYDSLSGIYSNVSGKVNKHTDYEYLTFGGHINRILTRKMMGVPAFAYAVFALVGFFIFYITVIQTQRQLNPYITSGTDKSIMVQALKNFHNILNGNLKPQITSSNPAEVIRYVREKAKFDPFIPEIEEFRLSGAYCNDYNGEILAHIIYRNSKDEIFYIYQLPANCIAKNKLELPEPVHKKMIDEKYYICDEVDENECTMALWFKNDVLCASLSRMPKNRMFVTFSNIIK